MRCRPAVIDGGVICAIIRVATAKRDKCGATVAIARNGCESDMRESRDTDLYLLSCLSRAKEMSMYLEDADMRLVTYETSRVHVTEIDFKENFN